MQRIGRVVHVWKKARTVTDMSPNTHAAHGGADGGAARGAASHGHADGRRSRAGGRPRNGGASAANPRVVAFDALSDVLGDEQAYANLLLPRLLSHSGMDERDRAFVTDLLYGTLRWMRLLDAVVSAAARRPLESFDVLTLDVLRLGAYQSLFMEVPDHAVVSQSVALAKRRVGAHAAGFVNAVMRRVVARGRQEWESIVVSRIPRSQDATRRGVRWSHPDWIVEALEASWKAADYEPSEGVAASGRDEQPPVVGVAEGRHAVGDKGPSARDGAGALEQSTARGLDDCDLMLRRDNETPSVTLVARPGLCTVEELEAALPHTATSEPGLWSPFAVRVHGVTPDRLSLVRDHRAGVEDEGSQLAAMALAAAPLASANGGDARGETGPSPDSQWLDMCAGPGGKTALLAAFAAQRGAHVTANEPLHHRADLVRQNVSAFEPGLVEVIECDGRELGSAHAGRFDRVLVDAPCSGLGALRRRPESRWRKQPQEIADLAAVQRDLLESAVQAVRSGGVIAYVTCSPVLAETRDVVDSVLAAHPEVSRLDACAVLRGRVPHLPVPRRGGDLQLFGHVQDTDQMFISLLRKA